MAKRSKRSKRQNKYKRSFSKFGKQVTNFGKEVKEQVSGGISWYSILGWMFFAIYLLAICVTPTAFSDFVTVLSPMFVIFLFISIGLAGYGLLSRKYSFIGVLGWICLIALIILDLWVYDFLSSILYPIQVKFGGTR